MKFNQKFILVFLFIFLTACVSSTKNMNVKQPLETNQGIVVTKIHSNWEGYNNPLLADLEFVFTQINGKEKKYKFSLSRKDDLKVVALPAGNYKWFEIFFGSYYVKLNGGFSIKPNEITYIGDIHSQLDLGLFSMSGETKISNQSKTIKADLKKHYPSIFSKYNFRTNLTNLSQK